MRKLSCIIVDDEPGARKILQEFVDLITYLNLLGKFENAMKAEIFLKDNEVDIIFLDIEMPKVSGLRFIRNNEIRSVVILTTAFPQYALDGYELDIIDYLLKPIAYTRFLKSVQKARDYIQMKNAQFSNLIPYIFVRGEQRIEKIDLNDILYAESFGNYVNIYLIDKKITAYLTLKSFEAQLPSHEFKKIHQSYLVNCAKISAIEGNSVWVNEIVLPIGRNFRNAVNQMVQQRLVRR